MGQSIGYLYKFVEEWEIKVWLVLGNMKKKQWHVTRISKEVQRMCFCLVSYTKPFVPCKIIAKWLSKYVADELGKVYDCDIAEVSIDDHYLGEVHLRTNFPNAGENVCHELASRQPVAEAIQNSNSLIVDDIYYVRGEWKQNKNLFWLKKYILIFSVKHLQKKARYIAIIKINIECVKR